MKFIIDAHLPPSLNIYFEGHDIRHTSNLKDGNFTPDGTINSLSVAEQRIVITKDADFYYLVKLGNMRLKEIKAYFERNTRATDRPFGNTFFYHLRAGTY
jgi:predicted nuclease of predicted toxin-antitoxin system